MKLQKLAAGAKAFSLHFRKGLEIEVAPFPCVAVSLCRFLV